MASSSSAPYSYVSTPQKPSTLNKLSRGSPRPRPHVSRSATFQAPSQGESSGSGSNPSPRFSRMLGSVLGSPFLTTSDQAADIPISDIDVVDGAMSAVPHAYTVTRPASPAPTMDFSMISPPSPSLSAIDLNRSFFATPPRRLYSSNSVGVYSGSGSPANPLKNILPRIWGALASPGKKAKGMSSSRGMDYEGYNYEDLPPLDGEEGELIDDEACFIDVRAVTGMDIVAQLPPEVALHLLLFLDLPSIIACLSVSRTWRELAGDNAIWRELFRRRDGWNVDLQRARARGWSPVSTLSPDINITTPSRLSHAIEEWGRRRLTSQASAPSPQRRSIVPTIERSATVAPLMLDWRVLYKARQEVDKRWATGEPRMAKISGHADSVYCLEFDATRIVTGSRDRTIKVWSLLNGKLLGTFFGHAGSVLCLKFDKDWDLEDRSKPGFMVSGSSDCSVCVWELRTQRNGDVRADVSAVLRGHSGGVLDLRIDERWIVSCSKDAVIRVWDRTTLALHCTLRGHEGPVNAVGLQSGRVVSASGDGKMMLWDIHSGERLRTLEGHDRGLACIEFKDDLIVSGSNDCKIKVWNASTGECVQTLVGHDALVRALAFDPATGRLVSASYDKTVKVWDLKSGKMIREFRNCHVSHIFDVKFDVCRIVSTSHDQKIVVLDFSQGLDTALFV
ncbi:hypothetical protein PLICRDRAFT_51871 [Plicaturopsis crispa FD-325 SS-3]|nr:hypothetical protein PLICRDRAFT_51871 [Plicaturopsis crispa FD-325 SS-3]